MRYDTGGLRKEQRRISEKVVVKDHLPRRIGTIAGFDTGYSGNKAKTAGVVLDYETFEILEKRTTKTTVRFPYIPTFLTFREGPPVIELYKKFEIEPDVLMFNGQGIAHPFRAGLASHVGVLIGKPSIGVAQKRLVGEYREPERKMEYSRLLFNGEQVGWVLKSKEGCRPVFISPGHMVSLQKSLEICLHCLRGRKLPEPLALAHELSK